jgi:hypothetical protein
MEMSNRPPALVMIMALPAVLEPEKAKIPPELVVIEAQPALLVPPKFVIPCPEFVMMALPAVLGPRKFRIPKATTEKVGSFEELDRMPLPLIVSANPETVKE